MKGTKLLSLALAAVMGLSMFATPAFAASGSEVGDIDGAGSIETQYYRLAQADLSTAVDYSWDDLTWTYCEPASGSPGWVKGNPGDSVNSGTLSHTAYAGLNISIPEQTTANLAQDLTVTRRSDDVVKLTILLNTNDNTAGLTIYEKDGDTYAETPEDSVTNVSLAKDVAKVYGFRPTANGIGSSSHLEGALTLSFSNS